MFFQTDTLLIGHLDDNDLEFYSRNTRLVAYKGGLPVMLCTKLDKMCLGYFQSVHVKFENKNKTVSG